MENTLQNSAKLTKYGIPFPSRKLMVAQRTLSPLPEGWTSLAAAFVQQARKNPTALFGRDTSKERVNYGEALVRSCAIARHVSQKLQGKQAIGIMLPPSVPAALANFAAVLLGKWSVNLNYTVKSEYINSTIAQCQIDLVITSRRLVEKQSLQLDCPVVCLEDLQEAITLKTKCGRPTLPSTYPPSNWRPTCRAWPAPSMTWSRSCSHPAQPAIPKAYSSPTAMCSATCTRSTPTPSSGMMTRFWASFPSSTPSVSQSLCGRWQPWDCRWLITPVRWTAKLSAVCWRKRSSQSWPSPPA